MADNVEDMTAFWAPYSSTVAPVDEDADESAIEVFESSSDSADKSAIEATVESSSKISKENASTANPNPPEWVLDLIKAIEDSNTESMGELLKNKGALEVRFDYRFPEAFFTTEGLTPLIFAAALGKQDIVRELLVRKADLSAKTTSALNTPFLIASYFGHRHILELLLKEGGNKVFNHKDMLGQTALFRASQENHTDIVEFLLNNGASLDVQNESGQTELSVATYYGNKNIMKALLEKGANIDIADNNGRTAFHWACWWNDDEAFQLLLEKLLSDSSDKTCKHLRSILRMKDTWGDTPLANAAAKRRTSVVLQVLETTVYFPKSPAEDEVFLSYSEEARRVAELLLWQFNDGRYNEKVSQHIKAVTYWAILNGQHELTKACMNKETGKVTLDREGMSWTHVAAIGGDINIMKYLLNEENGTLGLANGDITPLHLAVKHGHLNLSEYLLNWLETAHSSRDDSIILNTILTETKKNETLICLAASGSTEKHRDIESLLWRRLRESIEQNSDFFSHTRSKLPGRVLELAARYETPREESYLRNFLSKIPDRPQDALGPKDKSNSLHLAVYHQCAMVVWWLLSNGGYLNENDINRAIDITQTWKNKDIKGDVIRDLLSNPPPILKRRARRDDHHLPDFQFDHRDHESSWGMIIDFHVGEDRTGFQCMRRPVVDIIYNEGPQEIMKMNKYHELDELKAALGEAEIEAKCPNEKEDASRSVVIRGPESERARREKFVSSAPTNYEGIRAALMENEASDMQKKPVLRWIHIPMNNLRCIEELIVRISRDRGVRNKEYRPLAQFVRRSCTELPAGGGKFYMKPQCVSEIPQHSNLGNQDDVAKSKTSDNTATFKKGDAATSQNENKLNNQYNSKIDLHERLALYMPYISWMNWPEKQDDRRTKDAKEKHGIKVESAGTKVVEDLPHEEPNESKKRDAKEKTDRREQEQSEGSSPAKPNAAIHPYLTLDQYYYVSLEDTTKRDNDQVLGRYIRKNKKWKEEATKDDIGRKEKENIGGSKKDVDKHESRGVGVRSSQDQHSKVPGQRNDQEMPNNRDEKDTGKILIVNQLWLWVLDEETIITSTTRQPYGVENSLAQHVLNALRDQEGNTSPLCARYMAKLIFKTATALFNKREIDISGVQKSPLDVFRDTIRDVRDEEAKLFQAFENSLDKLNSGKPANTSKKTDNSQETTEDHKSKFLFAGMWKKIASIWKIRGSGTDPATANPYYDIMDETKGLREVKDICDELNILKVLTEDQEDVWKGLKDGQHATFSYDTPTEIREELEEMIKEAKTVQKGLESLLNLKQKQANINEAKSTREQSDTIMVFTVVTIVFLPASFLTSLFALNIIDFPHKDGVVAYQGRWIFPIIFGVSMGVSVFFMAIAFKANALKNFGIKSSDNQDGTKPQSKRSHEVQAETRSQPKTSHEDQCEIAFQAEAEVPMNDNIV